MEVETVLQTACKQKASVMIVCVDSQKICQGRFKHFANGLLSVELLESASERVFKPLSQCVFISRWEHSAWVFLTLVNDFYEDTQFGTLVVYEPHQVAFERRSAVRVPIYRDQAPLVRLRRNGKEIWTPQAIDISLTGILVQFPASEVPEMRVDTPLRVELKFEEAEVNLTGQVRRRDGPRYGIFFSDVLKGESIEPPDALVKLVRKLERIWLHRRAG